MRKKDKRMKRQAVVFILLLEAALLITGCSERNPEQLSPSKAAVSSSTTQLPKDWTFIQHAEANLYGDKTAERISLAAKKDDYRPQTRWQLWVKNQKLLELDNQDNLYDFAEISWQDLDGDKYSELLVYRINRGSGAGRGLNIYKLQEKSLSTLLETDPGFEDQADFSVNYLGSYQVHFQSRSIGIDTIIKLNPDSYKGLAETELQKINTWVDPIAEYQIEDLDHDGQKEITGIRRVIGMSHPDTIASLRLDYKLSHDKQKYDLVSYTLNDADGKQIVVK